MIYFKVLDGRKSCYGGNTKWVMGRWMPAQEVDPCKSGYHLCRHQDLVEWLGKDIYLAEGRGKMIVCDTKVVFEQARIVKKLDTWNEKSARLFACWCVRQIWHLLKDERSKSVVRVAERYARGKATQEELAAAEAAAEAAARAAEEVAAEAAARKVVRAAAEAAARATAEAAARATAEAAAGAPAWMPAAWMPAVVAARKAARATQTKRLMKVLGIKGWEKEEK